MAGRRDEWPWGDGRRQVTDVYWNFEDCVEDELTDMEVTMLMEPIQVDDTEQDDMALGLAILTSESYVTPTKTVRSSTFL